MASIPPGWYQDPWSAVHLRWWDGTQWTHMASPHPQAHLQHYARVELVEARRTEVRMRLWARAAVCVYPFVLLWQLVAAFASGSAIRNLFHQLRNPNTVNNVTAINNFNSHVLGLRIAGELGQLVLAGAGVLLLIWQFNAAKVAAGLGYPARRSPGLGVGSWFIPIVNFWFPYQALRDLLPPPHPSRQRVLHAWLCYVGTGLLAGVTTILAIFVPVAGIVMLVLTIAVGVTAVTLGWRLIAEVEADHRRAMEAAGLGNRTF